MFSDTGTTLLMLPKDIVAEYYEQVPGAQDNPSAGGYVVPCDAELPDFAVEIAPGTSITASASIPGIALPSPTVSISGGAGGGAGGGIIGGGSSGSDGILGRSIRSDTPIPRRATSTSTSASASTSTSSEINSQSQGTYKAITPGKYIKMSAVGDGESSCFGGIQSSDGMEFSVFGDVFLKNQYVVFDAEGPRLGFAPQAS